MTIKRKPNWPALLAHFLTSRRTAPFEWGKHDCGLHAADAILAMTGVDLAAPLRGNYNNHTGAMEVLHSLGATDLVGFVEATLAAHGIQQVPVFFGQRGDLALYQHPTLGPTLTIIHTDARKVCGPGDKGMAYYPRKACVKVWRI